MIWKPLGLGGSILLSPCAAQLWPGPLKPQGLCNYLPSEQSTGLTNIVVWWGAAAGWDSGGLGSSVNSAIPYASLASRTHRSGGNNTHGLPTSIVKSERRSVCRFSQQ